MLRQLLFGVTLIIALCLGVGTVNEFIFNGKLTPYMPLFGMVCGFVVAKISNLLF